MDDSMSEMDMCTFDEVSANNGRYTSRTSSWERTLIGKRMVTTRRNRRVTLKRYSRANFASCRTLQVSCLRPHCDGPMVSATAIARTLRPRAKADFVVVESVGIRPERANR